MSTNASISQEILTSLGGGSGIDIFKLARDLSDVEKEPKQLALETSISKTEASISAYSAISYQIGTIKSSFQTMDDADELAESNGSSSNSDAITFTSVSGGAIKADYDIGVSQLAQTQRTVSNLFDASDTELSGESFDIDFAIGSSTTSNHTVTVSTGTPQGVVDAINSSNIGVTASLVSLGNSADQYQIILEGAQGVEGAFSVSSDPDLGFSSDANTLQESQNAIFSFNGVTVERAENEISDLINGATFQLKSTTDDTVGLSISNGESLLKNSVVSLVNNFNDLHNILNELINPDSTIENGGALANDFTGVRYIEQQLRDAIFDDSPTESGSISNLRDIGITTDKTGKLVLDEAKLDQVISSNYLDVKTMLTANTNNQSTFSAAPKGLALSAIEKLEGLIESGSVISDREANAREAIVGYEEDLVKLEAKMEAVYERYLTQFSAMESLVRQMNSTRDYLEGQFEMMANVYKD